MANKSKSMLEIRSLIQKRLQNKSINLISKELNIHRLTVSVYLKKLESSQQTLSELLKLDDTGLSQIVYSQPYLKEEDTRLVELKKLLPEYRTELQKTGVTRKLLWQEYRANHPEGYGYTQFCEYLGQHLLQSKATMHFSHKPGETLQIDFAGKQLSYIDKRTGEIMRCPVLICTLPFSNYTYAEALPSMSQIHLISALNRCLLFFGGVPKNVLSDNMKQMVIKNNRYEFDFNELAMQWSLHYQTNLDATRPRKPKDKPSVENHVKLSYLRIYSKLRHSEIFSLKELNHEISIHLNTLNKTSFQKLTGSRLSRFEEQEKSHLMPLPTELFQIKNTTNAKVCPNYHVILGEDRHFYSVPFQYIGKKTKIIYDQNVVEVFFEFDRIAVHQRNEHRNGYSTLPEHLPEKHARYLETKGWSRDYFLELADKIGPKSKEVFQLVLNSKRFEEQSYNACIGLKQLALKYSFTRFEAACQRALLGIRVNYNTIKNILENNQDQVPCPMSEIFKIPEHENIRGANSYK